MPGHKFTQELFDTLCERIADGNSLRSVCKADDMPHQTNVNRWLDKPENDALRLQYTRACEARADHVFEDILSIADESKNDVRVAEDGTETVDHENIQRARLRVDARKWMLGKMQPKKYSDKIDLNVAGSFSVNIGNDDAECG